MFKIVGYGSFVCIGSKFRAPKLYFTYCCRRNCHQGGVLEQIQKNPDNPTTREYILEQIWSKNCCLGTFETLNCRILRIFNVSFSIIQIITIFLDTLKFTDLQNSQNFQNKFWFTQKVMWIKLELLEFSLRTQSFIEFIEFSLTYPKFNHILGYFLNCRIHRILRIIFPPLEWHFGFAFRIPRIFTYISKV